MGIEPGTPGFGVRRGINYATAVTYRSVKINRFILHLYIWKVDETEKRKDGLKHIYVAFMLNFIIILAKNAIKYGSIRGGLNFPMPRPLPKFFIVEYVN